RSQQPDPQAPPAAEPFPAPTLALWSPAPGLTAVRPTDYFFEAWDPQGSEIGRSYPTTAGDAEPALPPLDDLLRLASNEQYGTVGSQPGSTVPWRILAFPVRTKTTQELVAWGVVAVPLTSVNE